MSSSKKLIIIFWGALGQAVHQAVLKSDPTPQLQCWASHLFSLTKKLKS
jgi:hypothetical protein